jgi:hypothetical protein
VDQGRHPQTRRNPEERGRQRQHPAPSSLDLHGLAWIDALRRGLARAEYERVDRV